LGRAAPGRGSVGLPPVGGAVEGGLVLEGPAVGVAGEVPAGGVAEEAPAEGWAALCEGATGLAGGAEAERRRFVQ
jgi:hypothetical protein